MCVTSKIDINQVNLLKYGVPFWCDFILLVSIALLQVAFSIHLFRTGFNLQEFCYVQSCIVYQSTAFSKTLALALQSKKLEHLFARLHEIHPATADKQDHYKIPEWLLHSKRVMQRYACMQIFMIASYLVIPTYTYGKVLYETGVWKMELPLKFWLPFDTDTVLNFYFVYMIQSWVGFSASICLSSSDLLLLAIVHLVCIHFNHIYRNFNELQLKPHVYTELQVIRYCVMRQNEIIQYVFCFKISLMILWRKFNCLLQNQSYVEWNFSHIEFGKLFLQHGSHLYNGLLGYDYWTQWRFNYFYLFIAHGFVSDLLFVVDRR